MKNIILLLFVAATMVFAGLYLRESNKLTHAQIAAEGLQQQVAELQSTVDDGEKKSVSLRAELSQVQSQAAAKDREIVQLRAASTNPAQGAVAAASSRATTH